MGRPKNPDDFGLVHCDDIELFIAREIWQNIGPQTERLLIAIEGYGRFWLWLEDQEPGKETIGGSAS